MPTHTRYQTPCRRCGIPVVAKASKTVKVAGICRDCRRADPAYVRAQLTGQPVIPR